MSKPQVMPQRFVFAEEVLSCTAIDQRTKLSFKGNCRNRYLQNKKVI